MYLVVILRINDKTVSNLPCFCALFTSHNSTYRAGRTGRLGRRGKVITLISKAEGFVVKRFENELGCTIIRRSLVIRRSL